MVLPQINVNAEVGFNIGEIIAIKLQPFVGLLDVQIQIYSEHMCKKMLIMIVVGTLFHFVLHTIEQLDQLNWSLGQTWCLPM